MTIETKFAPGEYCWLMENNKTIEVQVLNLSTSSQLDGIFRAPTKPVIAYRLGIKDEEANGWRRENLLFPTKEALLASL